MSVALFGANGAVTDLWQLFYLSGGRPQLLYAVGKS